MDGLEAKGSKIPTLYTGLMSLCLQSIIILICSYCSWHPLVAFTTNRENVVHGLLLLLCVLNKNGIYLNVGIVYFKHTKSI